MKDCRHCGAVFEQAKGVRTTFCSEACRLRAYRLRRRDLAARTCENCGELLPPRATRWCKTESCVAKRRALAREAERLRGQRRRQDPEYTKKHSARCADYQAKNLDRRREYDRAVRTADPSRGRAKSKRRKAARRGATVVPFTPEQLVQRLSMYRGCWICMDPRWTEADHVKPLAAGGPHMLANLRPACSTCNRRKGATWPFPTRMGV